jgi:hypothetical protein
LGHLSLPSGGVKPKSLRVFRKISHGNMVKGISTMCRQFLFRQLLDI